MSYLVGLSCLEVENLLTDLPKYRAKQIYKWVLHGVKSFEEMTDLPVSLRDDLNKRFKLYSSTVDNIRDDKDAKKIILNLKDGNKIEAVVLNDGKERYTACLSTQVGCPAGCVFCKTGSIGFKRNLNSNEIVEQFLFLRDKGQGTRDKNLLSDSIPKITKINPPSPVPRPLSPDNIVIMGMGEPLLNLANLRKALLYFTDPNGLNFSKRRITVSTCGITDGLLDLAENGPTVRLALSLTTADEPLRQKLMPITKHNPLSKVKQALTLYQKNSGHRVTLEIPLLGGINTRDKDADSVAEFAKGMDTVINIIPWNPVAGFSFENYPLREPDKKEVDNFIAALEARGLKVTMRLHKGRKVAGACGQLG